jgi:ribulose-5-phosphate 4-epimerase/fuculose-1-phosphate aldolase
MFLKNHGVVTVGNTVAQAYRRLYKLEKACQTQVLAMSTGEPLEVMSEEVVAEVLQRSPNDRHPIGERERLYFEAMMRVLDRVNPGYAD